MDLLFSYQQEKLDKNKNSNVCNLNIKRIGDVLEFEGYYDFEYTRMDEPKSISYIHKFTLNLKTGDITTRYQIKNSNLSGDIKLFRNCDIHKKNNFKLLYDLTENGIYRGEKRSGYWGVKYYQQLGKMIQVIYEILKSNIKTPYILEKLRTPDKCYMNELYDLIVDFHLDKKNIKSHDSVYYHIQHDYPKKKWLKKNDNKFLPAVLDAYGIKSKYLIGQINKKWSKTIHISTLNYFCKLFGDEYIDYLKQVAWEEHCFVEPPNKRTHVLKNDLEKKHMVKMIQNWENENIRIDTLIYSINKLLILRDDLHLKGLDLKFNAKSDTDYELLNAMWQGYKQYMNRGYKLKYEFDNDFIMDIENDFEIDGVTFKPKILISEDDFRNEGFNMKNCMANQFIHGLFSVYVSLQMGRKKINLQFRKGNIIQSFGKANTPVPDEFQNAIEMLNEKFKKYIHLTWTKTKYDIISS
jgi:hypothetical protein